MTYERDLTGYGGRPPDPAWPGGARVAVQFVLNVEEGAERTVLNGDDGSEDYLHELAGRPRRLGERDPSVESMYEYGARAGVWRILDLFRSRGLPLTAFAVGRALELNPDLGRALADAGHEIAGHGYRWVDYREMPEEEERRQIELTCDVIERICGRAPVGWYTGRVGPNTVRLIREDGRFLYTSDTYADDLPYRLPGTPALLAVPYSLVTNDARYLFANGPVSGTQFFELLRDAFDCLWEEGERRGTMMSVGLHGRISGHPARALALVRFLDHVEKRGGAWICRREEVARHWGERHPD